MHIRLSNGIHVTDKVDASGAISLDGGARGIFVGGKVDASGSIDITGNVVVVGAIKSSGKIRIRAGNQMQAMKLGTKVECYGGCTIEGHVESR